MADKLSHVTLGGSISGSAGEPQETRAGGGGSGAGGGEESHYGTSTAGRLLTSLMGDFYPGAELEEVMEGEGWWWWWWWWWW
jgi:hypothetical protein